MRKFVVLLAVILLVSSAPFAQENMGARPIGMGGAFTAVADDVNAIFVNPGGIGYLKGELAVVSTKFSTEDEYTILGGTESTPYGTIGVGYVSASERIAEIDTSSSSYEEAGEAPVRTINQTLILSYARQLNDFMVVPRSMGKLSVGTNLKFASSRVTNAKGLSHDLASGLDVDLAAVLKPNDRLSCGFSLRNLMGRGSGDTEGSALEMAFGLSGKVSDSVTLSVENSGIGCEWYVDKYIALRVGRDGEYNTAGAGLYLEDFGIDYAFMQKESPVHYLAITIAINGAEEDLRQASLDIQ
jgi:hypothetical protein